MPVQVQIDSRQIASALEANLARYAEDFRGDEIGQVTEVGDGVARIDGLPGVMVEEMLLFDNGVFGMAMNLERHEIGAVILGDYAGIMQGMSVR